MYFPFNIFIMSTIINCLNMYKPKIILLLKCIVRSFHFTIKIRMIISSSLRSFYNIKSYCLTKSIDYSRWGYHKSFEGMQLLETFNFYFCLFNIGKYLFFVYEVSFRLLLGGLYLLSEGLICPFLCLEVEFLILC